MPQLRFFSAVFCPSEFDFSRRPIKFERGLSRSDFRFNVVALVQGTVILHQFPIELLEPGFKQCDVLSQSVLSIYLGGFLAFAFLGALEVFATIKRVNIAMSVCRKKFICEKQEVGVLRVRR